MHEEKIKHNEVDDELLSYYEILRLRKLDLRKNDNLMFNIGGKNV